jgi:hypothetical protein
MWVIVASTPDHALGNPPHAETVDQLTIKKGAGVN